MYKFKKENWIFLKRPEFWITTVISIVLFVIGGFWGGMSFRYYSFDKEEIENLNGQLVNCQNYIKTNANGMVIGGQSNCAGYCNPN